MKTDRVFDPPPAPAPVLDEAAIRQERIQHCVEVLLTRAHYEWQSHPTKRISGVSLYLFRHEANLDHIELNSVLPDPEDVWRGVQEGLPRHVVLTVADYTPGTISQTATLTWREPK